MDHGDAGTPADSMVTTWRGDVLAILDRDLPWGKLAGRRVVVTGSGGFLGGYLTRTLLELYPAGKVTAPVEVVALVRSASRAARRLYDVAGDPHLTFDEWDLTTIAVPELGDVDYILHAASQASPRFYGTDPVGTGLPNTVGTAALLTALQNSPDPQGFLFVSSGEVYGSVPDGEVLAETHFGALDPATVRAAYGESKRFGENLCVAWYQQYGLAAYIVRPFHTYGPGLQPNDGRIFADFTFNVMRSENLVMASDGSAVRTYCYVSDAIAGFFTVLLAGAPATPYNVSNREAELSVLGLADLLTGLYPERGLRVERHQRSDPKAYLPSPYQRLIPDVTRLTSLGWRAEIEPEVGFRRMVDAYPEGSRSAFGGADKLDDVSGRRKLVQAVMPAYNEADNVDEMVRRLGAVFDSEPDYDFEALIVENGSVDDSYEKLLAANRRDPRFKVVQLARNFGSEGGLTAGLSVATGDAVVLMMADLQDPPELIPTFLRKWEEGYENVYGIVTKRTGTNPIRRMNSRLFYWLAARMTNDRITRDASDFRLLDRGAYEAVRSMDERNRFVRGLVSWVGFKSVGVPMVREPRFAGKSKAYSLAVFDLAFKGIFAHSYVPLRLITIMGFMTSFLALVTFVVFLIRTVAFGVPFDGFGTIVSVVLLGFGAVLLLLGVVGEYIGLIYEEVKSRPNFIIARTIGLDETVAVGTPQTRKGASAGAV